MNQFTHTHNPSLVFQSTNSVSVACLFAVEWDELRFDVRLLQRVPVMMHVMHTSDHFCHALCLF